MSGRAAIAALGLALGLAALAIGCGSGDSRPPNIVLIIGDDHGYRDAGFMGSELVRTPNLDRLASAGTVFPLGYSTASVCRPALRTLLTGLYPIQFDRRTAHLARAGIEPTPLRDRFHTLPAILARRGYASFQSGKHPDGTFADTGFSDGMTTADGPLARLQGIAIARKTMDPVFEFIDDHREQPFFVWFAPQIPHLPHDPPEEFVAPYKNIGLPWLTPRYYGSVTWLDASIGSLVAHLERRGLVERTLIVYLSDNGWQPPGPGVDYDYKLGGAKGKLSLHETGFRTPILFHWPGRVPAGARRDALVSSVDLFPTLLAFAGATVPDHRPGRDLRPLIAGEAAAGRAELIGTAASLRTDRPDEPPGGAFLRSRRWHYLRTNDGRESLYDVAADPDEANDVKARHPEVVRASRAQIGHWIAEQIAPVDAAGTGPAPY